MLFLEPSAPYGVADSFDLNLGCFFKKTGNFNTILTKPTSIYELRVYWVAKVSFNAQTVRVCVCTVHTMHMTFVLCACDTLSAWSGLYSLSNFNSYACSLISFSSLKSSIVILEVTTAMRSWREFHS